MPAKNPFTVIANQHRQRQAEPEEYSATNNPQPEPGDEAREFGPPPAGRHSNPEYTQKSYWVRKDVHRAFKILCEIQGTDMSSELQDMILRFLRERTGANPSEDPVKMVIANLIRFTVE